ncbi:DUF2637 domain-containing protein [Streptomyces diacarni]|uniref:DUF2637 domain-containing protein n=1 Tax=Streptomyces diacarni TaxID=2800381 RepID=UPI0015F05359|nr:DUF2637 domain-containing protein [Streptomyces diacarni]
MQGVQLTRIHRILITVVIAGAMVIAAIGFAGSYAAVRDLAERKGFGAFAPFFPVGVDAGIVVLLALDLLLTWIRIPFPLLRQTAWLLTAATIAFNGAAAWPDPLGVGMHAVIPVLFVVTVEAARHATGRVAAITADKHMEGVRLSRWMLAFPSTFLLWRRMKLWELRSYDQVIRMEQDRLIYETRLRARYGRAWRRRAPVEALMPLKLVRYGVPLRETAPEATRLPESAPEATRLPEPAPAVAAVGTGTGAGPDDSPPPAQVPHDAQAAWEPAPQHETAPEPAASVTPVPPPAPVPETAPEAEPEAEPAPSTEAGNAPPPEAGPAGGQGAHTASGPAAQRPAAEFPVPVAPGRYRRLAEPAAATSEALSEAPAPAAPAPVEELFIEPTPPQPAPHEGPEQPGAHAHASAETHPGTEAYPAPDTRPGPFEDEDPYGGDEPVGIPDGIPREEVYFEAYRHYVASHGAFPTARHLSRTLHDGFGVTTVDGRLLSETYLGTYMREFKDRYNTEMGLAG